MNKLLQTAQSRIKELEGLVKIIRQEAGDVYDGSDWHTGRHALADEIIKILKNTIKELKEEK